MSIGVPAVSLRYSLNTASESGNPNASENPIIRANIAAISQSSSASPGGSTSFGTNEIRRSELVITPSFSGHWAAGSRTSAWIDVSVGWNESWTTTSSAGQSARCTIARSGIVTAGYVHMIQTALTTPAASASKISTAGRPGRGEILSTGTPQ